MDHQDYTIFRSEAEQLMKKAAHLMECHLAYTNVDPTLSVRQFNLGLDLAMKADAIRKWLREAWAKGI